MRLSARRIELGIDAAMLPHLVEHHVGDFLGVRQLVAMLERRVED
jgi:hypothetical protein